MTAVVYNRQPCLWWWSAAITTVAVIFVSLPLSKSSSSFSSFIPSSGNGLWDDLVGKCGDGPKNTMDCVRSRLYNYVNDTFESDLNITEGIKFTRNANNYEALCHAGENITGSHREARAPELDDDEVDDGWKDVTDELYDRGAKYLVTHDFEATVPGFLGGGPGAKVRLSPKKILPDGGIILRMDVLPAEQNNEARSAPRMMHKVIKQFFKKKLLRSALALILILKLIKIKVMFLLPLLIGAGAAKKILLKVLLFLFPPLAHLFKLCSYYHHHASKFYHFHHHKVKHHHHHLKIPIAVPIPAKPPSYVSEYYAGPTLDHPPGPYDSPPEVLSPPSDSYYNRNSLDSNSAPGDSMDELASWGLGEFGTGEGTPVYDGPKYSHSSAPSHYEPSIKYGPPSGGPPPPYAEKYVKRVDENQVAGRVPSQQMTHDPVFTPVLQKLDEIFVELGVLDEPCKEKLVCRMYGNPTRFSPHSNLVSAQLSSETAASSGERTAVSGDASKLWRYVQAAKEGQNGEDCRVLYPHCQMAGL